MGNEIHFDVNLISKIRLIPSKLQKDYIWKWETTTPKYKRIFFFFKIRDGVEIKPSGFYKNVYGYHNNQYRSSLISEEYIKYNHFIIKDSKYPNDGKEVWSKTHVEVSLSHGTVINKSFDTDEEGKEWVEKLKKMSGKMFEVIIYQ